MRCGLCPIDEPYETIDERGIGDMDEHIDEPERKRIKPRDMIIQRKGQITQIPGAGRRPECGKVPELEVFYYIDLVVKMKTGRQRAAIDRETDDAQRRKQYQKAVSVCKTLIVHPEGEYNTEQALKAITG